ncbi:MAG: S-layer homology domain-containing protein [Candidatus Ornithomonoglobus sp.]
MNKRVIGLIAVISLIFGMLPLHITAASEEPDYRMEIIRQLGIAPDQIIENADDNISRMDFAVLAARLHGYNGENVNESYFADIHKEHYASGSISYLVSIGALDGYSDSNFRGERDITYAEAAKILVTMLGYEEQARMSGGWQTGYIAAASSVKLDEGIKVSADSPITKKQACRMIYNALDVALCEVEFINADKYQMTSVSDKTPMSEWLNIEMVKGIIKTVGTAAVTTDTTGVNGVTVGQTELSAGDTDISYLLGMYCEVYYYSSKSDKDSRVAAAAAIPSKNNITVINSDDVISYENGVLTYYENTARKRVSISKKDEVSLNGQAVAAADREDALLNCDGEITINTVNSDNIEHIVMISSYETYVVTGVRQDILTVYGRYDRELDVQNAQMLKVYDELGKECQFDDIVIGEVLTVLKNKDESVVTIYRSSATVNGTMSAVNEEENAVYYKIDNDSYRLTKEYKEKGSQPSIGTTVKVLLDKFGRIAYIDTADNSWSYGYLCKIVPEENEEMSFFVKFYTTSGNFVQYTTSDKIKIDNERPKNENELMSFIIRGNEDVRVSQMVRYKLNSNNEVSELDTAYLNSACGENENSLRIMYKGYSAAGDVIQELTYKPTNNWEHKVIADGRTSYITAAKDYAGNEKVFGNRRKDYVNGYAYAMNAYCANINQLIPDVILSFNETAEDVYDEEYAIIKKVVEAVNKDGDEVFELTVATRKNAEYTCYTAADKKLDDITDKHGTHTIGKGDFVYLKTNVLGEVVGADLKYDAVHGEWQPDAGFDGSFHGDNVSYGTAKRTDGSTVQLALSDAALQLGDNEYSDYIRNYSLDGVKVFIYNSATGKVEDGSASEIASYRNSGNSASKLVISADCAEIGLAVIYR